MEVGIAVDGPDGGRRADPEFPDRTAEVAPTYVELGIVYQSVVGEGAELFIDNVVCVLE